MGTHPIFESDFDCLTEIERNVDRGEKSYHGPIGQGQRTSGQ